MLNLSTTGRLLPRFCAVLTLIALVGCGRDSIDLLEEETAPPVLSIEDAGTTDVIWDAYSPLPLSTEASVAPTWPPPSWTSPHHDHPPTCDEPCPPYAAHCNPQTLLCVECLNDAHCGPGSVCNREEHECVQCMDMSDCSARFYYAPVCDHNLCRPCRSDAECPGDFDCYNGGCFRPSPPPEPCQSDAECADGFKCYNDWCLLPPSAEPCRSDAECQDGFKCFDGGCFLPPSEESCRSDAECQDGLKCYNGGCFSPVSPPTDGL